MSKSLSFDTIVAALAVLSAGTVAAGCNKIEPEKSTAAPAAPAPTAPAATAAPNASATETPAAATPASPQPATAEPGRAAAVVDAGAEIKKAVKPAKESKSPAAACGAQGCSPDMKKLTP